MTRLLIGFDGSLPARAALVTARALFGPVDATIAHVHPPAPSIASAGIARAALPQDVIEEGITNMRATVEAEARTLMDEGVDRARSAGLNPEASLRSAITPWRELQKLAGEIDADAIVCGTDGDGALQRAVLGSTASSLLYHADRPLLVVPGEDSPSGLASLGEGDHPGGVSDLNGPLFAGYDGSDGARAALRFAARHVPGRPLLVAHAVDSRSDVPDDTVAEAGAEYARELGLDARALTPVAGRGAWRTLAESAEEQGAAAVLVGSRGRGAVASTVLGSVASGLVHAAALPVLVVPSKES